MNVDASGPELDRLADAIAESSRVAVLCGAGISAASGVPTFRGKDGLWRQHRAEELATPEAFAADPQLVWDWYGWRRRLILPLAPNPAHHALEDLARHVEELTIITQNVDGLHARARATGGSSARILEVHGNLWTLRCTRCGAEVVDRSENPPEGTLPTCECGGLQRPGVVWFGESLPADAIEAAAHAAGGCEVFLVVGTSALVQPAASFATMALHAGATVAEFNPEATPLSGVVDFAFAAPAEESLPALAARVEARRTPGPAS